MLSVGRWLLYLACFVLGVCIAVCVWLYVVLGFDFGCRALGCNVVT